jgi:PAS domain S-box-containing protein
MAVFADITDRRRMEQALRESEERFGQLVSRANDIIYRTDAGGHFAFANPIAIRITGYSEEELAGKHYLALVRPDFRKDAERHYGLQFVKKTPNTYYEFPMITKEGGEVWLGQQVQLIMEGDSVIGFQAVARDITERVRSEEERARAEETLRHYTAELEASNQELDAFAHTVAHDLKSPLAWIVGYAELLGADHAMIPAEELRRRLETIARSGRKMSAIIDGLLLLSSVRQAAHVTHPLDMASIVAQVRNRLAPMIEEYQAELVLPAQEAWPVVMGYGPWVEEVWVNYLINALKYGGRPPRVELAFGESASRRTGEPAQIRFWVCDNGHGIAPEDQTRLFTPFTRLDQVQVKGHGLGLSIVRRIVERLGGQVGVESRGVPGQGSAFFFTLPAAHL